MKNKINYLTVALLFSLLLISCSDNNDELADAYDEAGEANPVLNDIIYELTSSDFNNFLEDDDDIYETFNAFPSLEDAEIKIAPILDENISIAATGLNVLVDVNYIEIGNLEDEDFTRYVTAEKYELESSDYPTNASNAFLPEEDIEETLQNIVTSNYTTAVEGEVVRVEYLTFDEEPIDGAAVFNETNFSTFEGWTPINVVGVQEWSEGNQFNNVQMSGFDGSSVENEDWLISPTIDLSDKTNSKIQIEQNYRFGSIPENLKILIATDFTGDQNTATWKEVTFTTLPTGANDDYVTSEKVDISEFEGSEINIALKYNSTTSDNFRWRVRRITLEAGGLEGNTSQEFAFFRYNGTEWESLNQENVYVLTDEEHDSMGAPGNFNNFSSSVLPENYLPQFLSIQYPFAQTEDSILLIYDYFFGGGTGTLTRGIQYVFNESWDVPKATLKFTYKNGRWEPNNAIEYEFIEADYDFVFDALADEDGLDDELSNLDRFGNFNRREGGSTYWDDAELLKALDVVLKENFPDTEIGKRYQVTISAFPTGTETFLLELFETGNYIYVTE